MKKILLLSFLALSLSCFSFVQGKVKSDEDEDVKNKREKLIDDSKKEHKQVGKKSKGLEKEKQKSKSERSKKDRKSVKKIKSAKSAKSKKAVKKEDKKVTKEVVKGEKITTKESKGKEGKDKKKRFGKKPFEVKMLVVNEHPTEKIDYVTLTQKSIDYKDNVLAGKSVEISLKRDGKAYLAARSREDVVKGDKEVPGAISKEVSAEISIFPAKKDWKKDKPAKVDEIKKDEKVAKVIGTLTLKKDGTFVYTGKDGKEITLK